MTRTRCVTLAAIVLFPFLARASTFNLVTDFQAGAFSYGWTATLGGAFNPYGVIDTTSHPGATALLRAGTFTIDPPYVAFNTTGSPLDIGCCLMPADQLIVHPGPGGEDTVVRFTAPTAGQYTVNGQFLNVSGTTTDVHVLLNGSSLFDGDVNGSNAVFGLPVTLALGDVLDFAVGFGTDGTYFGDMTGIQGTIVEAVPEPQPAALLAVGLFAMVGLRRLCGGGRKPAMR